MTAMGTRTLRMGTRGSALALAQSRTVAAALRAEVELVEIATAGDLSASAIAELGGTGVFVTALRDRLQSGQIDLAVHSYKDLPTEPMPGLVIAAVPVREDPRDVLVASSGHGLADLGTGARVGTGAPRRMAQLRALGLGLEVVAVRGNVDTRLRKVADGELDAVVLARAGLARLGRLGEVTQVLDPIQILPAPAQGALAVECRLDDTELVAMLSPLDDPDSRAAVDAERALLAALDAGCTAPVGALAEVAAGETDEDAEIYLRGSVTALDGSDSVRLSATGPIAEAGAIGRRLAADLLAAGAHRFLNSQQTGSTT
ncbi:MAG: hydroxymethylbilane synthase [Actinomycetota bacterium]|nr:hydroxymethylbilane synthase [Actinomycetota bacterium]